MSSRLRFSNVPTSTGGVISGDISTGAGSPFGKGGKYEAQVNDIKATIAQAPPGTYDPKYWDDFLTLDPKTFPPELLDSYVPSDDHRVLRQLTSIPTAREALNRLSYVPNCERRGKCSQEQKIDLEKEREEYRTTIGLHINHILMKENKSLIEQVAKIKRDEEINKAVKLALDEASKAFDILPEASAEQPLSETRDIVTSMPRVPGQTISERGAGASVPIAEQQPQTDIFGNVIPAYEPPTTISGTRGQIKYADPSTESGLRSNPLSIAGQVVYETFQDIFTPIAETLGIQTTDHIKPPETTQEATQQPIEPVTVDPTCPARVQIISNLTNVVAGEGLFDCATIQRYEDNPDYRVVYVNGQEAIPTQQPEQEQLAPILQCADVYRWENGNVSKSSGQFTLSQLQGYISQGLMIRLCNTTRPTDQEVKDHYGIVTTSEVEPPLDEEEPTTDLVVPPTPTMPAQESGESCEAYRSRLQSLGWSVDWISDCPPTTDHIPPDVTVTPSEPTNFGMAGILFAGVLALPILAGFGKWK